MLQFVLEFATTKATSVSPAEDSRQAASSPTPPSAPLSEAIAKESRCLPFSTLLFLYRATALYSPRPQVGSRKWNHLLIDLIYSQLVWFHTVLSLNGKSWHACNCCVVVLAFFSDPGESVSSESLGSSVSSCQRTPIYKPFTQCRQPIDCPPHPAPHSITEEELHFAKTCLQRWRTEVENDINGILMIILFLYPHWYYLKDLLILLCKHHMKS